MTMLSESVKAPLQEYLRKVKAIHEKDLRDGCGRALLPETLTVNIRMPQPSGDGSGYSHRNIGRRVHGLVSKGGIT